MATFPADSIYVTIVGSRDAELRSDRYPEAMPRMRQVVRHLNRYGFVHRTGDTFGIDRAAREESERVQVFTPKNIPNAVLDRAMQIASDIHRNWHACTPFMRLLHARDVLQVLGNDLETPSSFLVCWTKNGKDVGGTRTAIITAREYAHIPVINIARDPLERIGEAIDALGIQRVPAERSMDVLREPVATTSRDMMLPLL